MQKKSVLLSVAAAVVTVAPVINTPMKDTQVLHLARLLLIFDYLMKNLYEAPQILIEQVCCGDFFFNICEKDDDTDKGSGQLNVPLVILKYL